MAPAVKMPRKEEKKILQSRWIVWTIFMHEGGEIYQNVDYKYYIV